MSLSRLVNWRFLNWVLCAISVVLLITVAGCHTTSLRSQNPDDEEDELVFKTEKIGDHVGIGGLTPQVIEGVGLVTNLDGTGGAPAPSMYRELLLKDMQQHNVPNPNSILESPNTALVLVKAVLPPAIQVGDRFDVEVLVPESANASSLAGGWLMECALSEQANVPGRGRLKGHEYGRSVGPVMVSTGEGDESSKVSGMKRGKVLGGGIYRGGVLKKDRTLELYLRSDYQSVRNSKRIADRIGRRFHSFEKGIKKPLAKATTDLHVQLSVHPSYKNNYVRYLQVIRHIALTESSVEEHARLERLQKTLLIPDKASESAMDLEAIGSEAAVNVLKVGLKSPIEEVRFYSADALAYMSYLSNADGTTMRMAATELAAAAERQDAFRVFALAAMSVIHEGEVNELLRELMNEYTTPQDNGPDPTVPSTPNPIQLVSSESAAKPEATPAATPIKHGAETRYGAFRAMWTLEKNDPFIHGEVIGEQQFKLHVLKTTGEPMIHMTRTRLPEVVIFGASQELRTPVALSAGRHIVIAATAGSTTVKVSRFEAGKPDQQRVVSLQVADVIHAVGELGGTYPDVAQMLTQAKRQSNLEGRLELDALPQAGRIFYRPLPSDPQGRGKETTVGQRTGSPNIFPQLSEPNAIDKFQTPTPSTDDEDEEDEDSAKDKKKKKGSKKSKKTKPADEAPGLATTEDVSEETAGDEDVEETDDSPEQKKPGLFGRLFSNPLKKSVPGQSEPELQGEPPVDTK